MKKVLTLALLLAAPLFVATQLRADTIVFHDLSDDVVVTDNVSGTPAVITNEVITNIPNGPERVSFTISEPSGGFITSTANSLHGLSEPGTTFASDLLQINNVAPPPSFLGFSANVIFTSFGETNLFPCSSILGGCLATEDGTPQTLAFISWSIGTPIIFEVQSDISESSPVPEPSSLLLLGTGLLGLGPLVRRRIRCV